MSANGANGTENANHQVTQKLMDELNDAKALGRSLKSKVRSLKRKLVKGKERRKTIEDKLQKIEEEAEEMKEKIKSLKEEAEEMKEKIKSLEEEAEEMKEKIKLLEEKDNADLAAAPKKYKRIMVIEDSEDEN